MPEPIRVLHVFGKLNMGGAETRVMDLYRHIDRTRVQFDFLVHHQITDEDRKVIRDDRSEELEKVRNAEDFDGEARSLGAKIYVLPRFTGKNFPEYRRACRTFFAAHHDWAVIEGHMTSLASVYLPIAKEAGVPVTIAHARSAGVDSGIRGMATKWFRRSLSRKCDIMMSCSDPASVAVFGEKAYKSGKILKVPNALDIDAFCFDPEARAAFRAKYGIPADAFVVGHVGRFDAVKNQKFLAEVGRILMNKLLIQGNDRNPAIRTDRGSEGKRSGADGRKLWHGVGAPSAWFVFLGKGALEDDVRRDFDKAFEVSEFHGSDKSPGKPETDRGSVNVDRYEQNVNVVFAGQLGRAETAAAYSAFDVFAFPSLYEGLPGTVIEAQASGLPCLISDTITSEVALTDLVEQLPLENPEKWAESIRKIILSTAKSAYSSIEGKEEKQNCKASERKEAQQREVQSSNARKKLDEAGYNVVTAAVRLQRLYERLAEVNDSDSIPDILNEMNFTI